MDKKTIYSFVLILLIFNGCTKQPTYSESLDVRVMPTTKTEQQKECLYLRQEISRMQSLYQQGSVQKCNPAYGLCMGPIIMQKANYNIASLENRASIVSCDSAFSTIKVINNQNSSIKECIEACKLNTNRTPTECFDSCNK